MKNNKIINKEVIENASSWEIFASGYFIDNGSTNICTTDRKLRWIAVRGGIPDWAVYFEPCYSDDLLFPTIWDDDLIKRIWDKFPKSMIKELFDEVSPHAVEWYRS